MMNDSLDKARRPAGKTAEGSSPALAAVYRGLLVFAIFLALVIAGVSAGAFFSRAEKEAAESSSAGAEDEGAGSAVFAGIGRLRLSTADSVMVIISPAFPYPRDDGPFSEELASRVGDLRAATEEYFSRRTAGELNGKDEGKLKAELLEIYNSRLRLGKIGALYFNDFMIIE